MNLLFMINEVTLMIDEFTLMIDEFTLMIDEFTLMINEFTLNVFNVQDYPHYAGDPMYYGHHPPRDPAQMHSFGDDTHGTLPMETEESSVTSLESGANFQMGPFLEAVMNKWEESEHALSKDRKKTGRRH